MRSESGKAAIKAGIQPFEGIDIILKNTIAFGKHISYDFTVTINPEREKPVVLHGKVAIKE